MLKKKPMPSLPEAEEIVAGVLARHRPDLVRLRRHSNVLGILARPSKIFAAAGAVLDALEGNRLVPGQPLIETSSGTMALSLAVICQALGLPLILVIDRWVQSSLRYQLELLGAHLVVAQEHQGLGSQANRLRVLGTVQQETGALYLNQYDCSHNLAGYAPLAWQLIEASIWPDVMIFPVGSGASSQALVALMRLFRPGMYAVGIDVMGSVPFGALDSPALRTIGGIGNSIMPRNIQHELFDEVHLVSGALGWAVTRNLLATEGLWRGETTGPAAFVACHYARTLPGATVVFFSPDDGGRYYDTVWNPEFPQDPHHRMKDIPNEPRVIHHPHEAGGDWNVIPWKRRTYHAVTGQDPDPMLYRRLENPKVKV